MEAKNKVVVVTGASRGIGLKIAEQFLEKGAVVIIADILTDGYKVKEELASKYGDHRVEFYQCDVTKDLEEIFASIASKYKTVDVLVNNAGVVDEESIDNTMNINAIAVMKWTMKFWEHMRVDRGGKGGTILNIASIYGIYSDPYLPFYKASKHAVVGFSKSLGHEQCFNKTNVRVVVVCPGFSDTKLLENPTLDVNFEAEFLEFMKTVEWQTADDVGKRTWEVYEKAESGSSWTVVGGKVAVTPANPM